MKSGNKLDNVVCYLCGSMEFCPTGGIQWRRRLKDRSVELGLNINWIDPTEKPKGLLQEDNVLYNKIKASKDWGQLTRLVKQIRREDLRCVDLSDFLIVRMDKNVHACGTYDELYTAEDQQKPILMISVGGKEALPGWLWAVVREEEIFDNEEQCLNYLVRLNSGEIKLDDRWVLFRDHFTQKELANA